MFFSRLFLETISHGPLICHGVCQWERQAVVWSGRPAERSRGERRGWGGGVEVEVGLAV